MNWASLQNTSDSITMKPFDIKVSSAKRLPNILYLRFSSEDEKTVTLLFFLRSLLFSKRPHFLNGISWSLEDRKAHGSESIFNSQESSLRAAKA